MIEPEQKVTTLPGLVIVGDLSIQGHIKSVRALTEPSQVSMDNAARRAVIPLENKRQFPAVAGDIVGRVDPIFFSDPMTAAVRTLGVTYEQTMLSSSSYWMDGRRPRRSVEALPVARSEMYPA